MVDNVLYTCYSCRRAYTNTPYKSIELGRHFCSKECWEEMSELKSDGKDIEATLDGDVKFQNSIEAIRDKIMLELTRTYPAGEDWKMQAYLWMHCFDIPNKLDGKHEVTGFKVPHVGDLCLGQTGGIYKCTNNTAFRSCPILRKTEPVTTCETCHYDGCHGSKTRTNNTIPCGDWEKKKEITKELRAKVFQEFSVRAECITTWKDESNILTTDKDGSRFEIDATEYLEYGTKKGVLPVEVVEQIRNSRKWYRILTVSEAEARLSRNFEDIRIRDVEAKV